VPSPLPPSSSSFSSGRSPLTPNATAPHIKGVGSADLRLEAGSSHTRSRGPHPKGWQTAWDAASPAAVRIPGSKLEVFIEITHLTPARYSEAKSKVDGGKNIYFGGEDVFLILGRGIWLLIFWGLVTDHTNAPPSLSLWLNLARRCLPFSSYCYCS
jgi:hypothetical protein